MSYSLTLHFCFSLAPHKTDKILALTEAAGVELEPIWASLLAKALEGKHVKDLLSNVGGGGAPAVGGGAAPAASGGAAAAEAPKEEEKKDEPKDESDDDMVRPLFLFPFFFGWNKSRTLTMCVGFRSLRLIALLQLPCVVTLLLLDRIIHPVFVALEYHFSSLLEST